MNTRDICDLKSDLANALAEELADALDQQVSGFHLEWYAPNGFFGIRTTQRPHGQELMRLYFGCENGPRLLYAHQRFENSQGASAVQHQGEYDMSDPVNTPEKIARDFKDMLSITSMTGETYDEALRTWV